MREGPVFPTCVGVFLCQTRAWFLPPGLPHVRGGVSAWEASFPRSTWVFPTCVGVFLSGSPAAGDSSGLPHVRGGVSDVAAYAGFLFMSSPRAWGCFSFSVRSSRSLPVFPTCVGVFPMHRVNVPVFRGLPHVRGGVSMFDFFKKKRKKSSPRAWGCFFKKIPGLQGRTVFPTCVGVFLRWCRRRWGRQRLPHVRGGVSSSKERRWLLRRSSPRAWGCFRAPSQPLPVPRVFPTCVGVFLREDMPGTRPVRLPHVRGGVSLVPLRASLSVGSSPRAWGCFRQSRDRRMAYRVFPTCVGVFPFTGAVTVPVPGLPHVRGGVSGGRDMELGAFQSSPRAWGCFSTPAPRPDPPHVFPTCVGVFLLGGGMSFRRSASSPRAWGCFFLHAPVSACGRVFPTCVGVFPLICPRATFLKSLPHVRGGVSISTAFFCPGVVSSPRAWGCFSGTGARLQHSTVFPTCVGVFLSPWAC